MNITLWSGGKYLLMNMYEFICIAHTHTHTNWDLHHCDHYGKSLQMISIFLLDYFEMKVEVAINLIVSAFLKQFSVKIQNIFTYHLKPLFTPITMVLVPASYDLPRLRNSTKMHLLQ